MRREGVRRGRIRAYPATCENRYSPEGIDPFMPVLETKEWYADAHVPFAGGPKLRNPRGVRGSVEGSFALFPKPTNFSYENGVCGSVGCWACHSQPVNRPLGKTKGNRKRKFQGDRTYHALDWVVPVGKNRGKSGVHLLDDEDESESENDDVGSCECSGVQTGGSESGKVWDWTVTAESEWSSDEEVSVSDEEGWERVERMGGSNADAESSPSDSDGSWERLEVDFLSILCSI